ncbi:hypothetical protein PSA01_23500 [Pseudonocardia saturnea]|uniref:Uncharacterized protein n=2 Tax=Pseudonocardiaceae TaxID=2070 RepID=A0ABQ0RXH3_9PSEU|nr:hypothetical protein [Pseudonocardia autotrophica]BBG01537.1 hypothetical protein Pdca_27460 [Pseudonocardia autotrophica]GEC25321.1 hypothetical protein PSA01_23500 [Pseudonocardia saturnea]
MILRRRGSHRRRLIPPTDVTDTATLAAVNPGKGPAYKKVKDRVKTRNVIIVGVLAGVLAMLVTINALTSGADKQTAVAEKQAVEQQRDEAVAEKLTLADQITAECQAGRLTGPVCPAAEAAKTRTPTPLPDTAALTAAVRDYLTVNPPPAGRAPTTQEVAAAVTTFLAANPPAPGRPPTSTEIEAAVRLYYTANPPAPGRDGQDGARGDAGRPPTSEEISTAVAAYLQANPPPAGRVGDPGVGVRTIGDPSRADDGTCQIRFELTDNTVRPIVVPDDFCGGPLLPGPGDGDMS